MTSEYQFVQYCVKTRLHMLMDLAQIRWGIQLYQTHLADMLEINRNYMSSLGSGTVGRIRFEPIARLCGYFGCKPGDMVVFIPQRSGSFSWDIPKLVDPSIILWESPPPAEVWLRAKISTNIPKKLLKPWRRIVENMVPGIDDHILSQICAERKCVVDDILTLHMPKKV